MPIGLFQQPFRDSVKWRGNCCVVVVVAVATVVSLKQSLPPDIFISLPFSLLLQTAPGGF